MFRYLKALWYMVTGRVEKARRAMLENEHVMSMTYDKSIDKINERIATTRDSITELVRIEQTLISQVKSLGERMTRLSNVKDGAQVAMQRRIDELKNKGMTKEQIIVDAEFIKHQAAYNDASSTLAEVTSQYDEKNADVMNRTKQIAVYKTELQKMQRSRESLGIEKEEARADVAIAKSSEAIDAQLAGLSTDAVDTDLREAREARQRAKARATVTADLIGSDAKVIEDEYLKFASQTQASSELDNILNWGEESKEELSPAKLPE